MERDYKLEKETNINEILIHNFLDINHIMRLLYEGKASQSRILIVLYEKGTISQRDLTEYLEIKAGSVSEILSKLEKSKLISRKKNKKDHRIMEVKLTKKGKELAIQALEKRLDRHKQMFSCLDDEEKSELHFLLEKLTVDWNDRFNLVNTDSKYKEK